jgi:hypothetical protein
MIIDRGDQEHGPGPGLGRGVGMIPTVIVVGLVVGRWWVLAVAAVGWVVLLAATGITGDAGSLAVGAGLAVANAGVGVAVHKGVAALFRALRAAISS